MIRPTNGRVVLFMPRTDDKSGLTQLSKDVPLAAHVAHVWGDRLVNLMVIDSYGFQWSRTSVTLLQDDDAKPTDGSCYAHWMDYQKGQAAKAEKAEAELEAVRKLASAGAPLI